MATVLTVFILYFKTLLPLLKWDTGKVRDGFGGMGRFRGGLRYKGWVNRCNFMHVFFKNISTMYVHNKYIVTND